MSDITVVLSTTKSIIASDLPDEKGVKDLDCPVICASMGLGLSGFGTGLEQEEHKLAQICKEMAKTVLVSSPRVFIGEDPSQGDTALIEYFVENSDNSIYQHFFEQYAKMKMLFMEFQVFGIGGKPIFSLKGLWVTDCWKFLDVYPSTSFSFTPK